MTSRSAHSRAKSSFALTHAVLLTASAVACACQDHVQPISLDDSALLQQVPVWTDPATLSLVPSTAPISAWKQNLSSATGHSTDATINSLINSIQTDVQQVWYDSNYAYIKYTDVPSHNLGAFPGNPAYPANQNRTSRILRSPTEAVNKVSTGLGAIGVMVNGGLIFNASDAMSYNNLNIWHRNANVAEASSFDVGPGHPAPQPGGTGNPRPGTYHYHQAPIALLNQLDPGNSGQHHSPLLGYAFDSFPIYGPYGYSDPNDSGSAIKRIISGYKLRDDIAATGLRTSSTEGGATLPAAQQGPAVSATFPAGLYLEDYKFDAAAGDLNQYNMRFAVTPEYPQGTWAYFVTLDSAGNAAYPYIVGPQYFGVVDTNQASVTIPAAALRLLTGDANIDRAVNLADFTLLAANFGQSGRNWESGDFDRNGTVSLSDFTLLASNFGMSNADVARSAVPEPAAALLLPALVLFRRRR